MSLTAPERETIITLNDEDGHALIYTAQRPIITKLKNPSAIRAKAPQPKVIQPCSRDAAV